MLLPWLVGWSWWSRWSGLSTVKTAAGIMEDGTSSEAEGSSTMSTGTYQELVAQVRSMSQQLKLVRTEVQLARSKKGLGPVCWSCRKEGHMCRDCPERRSSQNTVKLRSVKYTSAFACTLTLKGAVEGHPTLMLADTGSSVTCNLLQGWRL